MKKLYSELLGQSIFCREAPGMVGRVFDLILDPSDGSLVAISVHFARKKIIGSRDILSWYPRIVIRDTECIVESDEIVRIQRILDQDIRIIGNAVVTESGNELGTVYDFLFDIDKTIMLHIMVAHSFLGIFRFGNRIIPAKRIVRIESDQIVVSDDARVREPLRKTEMGSLLSSSGYSAENGLYDGV